MRTSIITMLLALAVACDRGEAPESGADVLQSVGPVEEIDIHVNGFHYASGDLSHQMEVDHYCHQESDAFVQCALYDGTERDANLIGIEYIVSRDVFDALPEDEKALWHPHDYEVVSGMLIAPGLPLEAEHELMESLVSTYGKTWHLWDSEADDRPLGAPILMKAFTEDGQLDPALLADRDQRYDVSTNERREHRADIADPGFDPVVLEEPQPCGGGFVPPEG